MEKFDLYKVLVSFQESLKDEDDVTLELYLKAYREVNRCLFSKSIIDKIDHYDYVYISGSFS